MQLIIPLQLYLVMRQALPEQIQILIPTSSDFMPSSCVDCAPASRLFEESTLAAENVHKIVCLSVSAHYYASM